MIIKKLLKQQAYWTEFLSGFYFVISYILNRKNKKADLFICQPNDYLANKYNN